MFKVTTVSVRPSKKVAFFEASAEFTAWFKTNYLDTNQCAISRSRSDDGLTLTSDAFWDSEASCDAYLAQDKTKAMNAERDAYNTNAKITRSVVRNGVPVAAKKK
jgi:hypothetical protein